MAPPITLLYHRPPATKAADHTHKHTEQRKKLFCSQQSSPLAKWGINTSSSLPSLNPIHLLLLHARVMPFLTLRVMALRLHSALSAGGVFSLNLFKLLLYPPPWPDRRASFFLSLMNGWDRRASYCSANDRRLFALEEGAHTAP